MEVPEITRKELFLVSLSHLAPTPELKLPKIKL